jgi:hypothetical protein
MSNDKNIEALSKIADNILRIRYGKDYHKVCISYDPSTDTSCYTEKIQDEFNEIYDDLESYGEIK